MSGEISCEEGVREVINFVTQSNRRGAHGMSVPKKNVTFLYHISPSSKVNLVTILMRQNHLNTHKDDGYVVSSHCIHLHINRG